MSALKSSQIQDMFIKISAHLNQLDNAVKILGKTCEKTAEAVSNLENSVADLEEKEKEREATKDGKWKSGEGTTETEGSVYVMEKNTDTPDTLEEGDEPEPQPVVGETTYDIKIENIPNYVPATKDTDATYVFTPSEAFAEDFAPDFSKLEASKLQVKGTQTKGEGEQAVTTEHIYTLSYANGTFVLTTDLATTPFVDDGAQTDPAIIEVVFDGGIVLEGVPKQSA